MIRFYRCKAKTARFHEQCKRISDQKLCSLHRNLKDLKCQIQECKQPKRKAGAYYRPYCTTHENQLRPRKLCQICERTALIRNPLCGTHQQRKRLYGDPMARICRVRSCRKVVVLEEEDPGHTFICTECLTTTRKCAKEDCFNRAHKTIWCSKHFQRKHPGEHRGRPRG